MSPTPQRQPGGARHAACKVHRDSHSIRKASSSPPPSSSSTNSSVSSSSNGAAAATNRPAPAPRQKQQQPRQPVIIYTHSPRVIRTNPRDFMSIVQKLTGLDSPPARGARTAGSVAGAPGAVAQDESSTSSSESCANTSASAYAAAPRHPYADPRLMPPPAAPLDAHFLAPDVPLFAPGPSELQLCVPMGLYDYDQFPPVNTGSVMSANVNVAGAAGNRGPVFSPSVVEAMRTFPDY